MTLQDFIKANDMTHASFGALVGVAQATINRYVRGERFPSPDMIRKIEAATEGKVCVADWYASSEAAE